MPDELLRPTIAAGAGKSARPWRPLNLTYIAVLGGVVPITWLAFVNSRRLGLGAGRRLLIAMIGLAGLVAEAVVFDLLDTDGNLPTGLLTLIRVVAALCYLIQMRLQRPMDRAFQLRGGDYATRFGAGNVILLGVGTMAELLIVAVAGS
jgi:hypothetical protein